MKILYYISAIVFFLVIILGLLMTMTISHELTHYFDVVNEPSVIVDEICFLQVPFKDGLVDFDLDSPAASVIYYANGDVHASELKATAVGIVVMIIVAILSLYFYTYEIWENNVNL